MEKKDIETVIIYHRDLDGLVSALIAKDVYPDAKMISVNHGEGYHGLDSLEEKRVIVVDFSYPHNIMQSLKNITKQLIWIDHHKTASKLKLWTDWTIDGIRDDGNTFAGCELAWKYFNPDKKIPLGVELVGDWDTWSFKHGVDTKAFHEALQLFDIETQNDIIKRIVFSNNARIKDYISDGKILINYKEAMVKRLYKTGHIERFEGHRCFVCHTNLFTSDLASYAFRMDPSVEIARIEQTKWDGKKWIIEHSLRSQGNVDVSKIAEKYGGGGHFKASGYIIPLVLL